MNWQQWKTKYKRELEHIAGFEENFVDLVLCKVPNLQPSDVIPQYHFIDSKGGNRYIDFMIINPSKNWLLPIELDGHTKLTEYGSVYEHFDDLLYRQNCIIQKFGTLLRHTNKRMFNHSDEIIHEIHEILLSHSNRGIKDTASSVNIGSGYISSGNMTAHISTAPAISKPKTYPNKQEWADIVRELDSIDCTPQPTFIYQNLANPSNLTSWRKWYKYYNIEKGHPFVEKFLKKLNSNSELFSITHIDDDVSIIYYQPENNITVGLIISDLDTRSFIKNINTNVSIRLTENEIYEKPFKAINRINQSIREHKLKLAELKKQKRKQFLKSLMNLLLLPFKILGNILKITENSLDKIDKDMNKFIVITILENIENSSDLKSIAEYKKELQDLIKKRKLSEEFIKECRLELQERLDENQRRLDEINRWRR